MCASARQTLALQREKQLFILAGVNQKLNENLDVDIILRTLVEAALELTGAKEGAAGVFTNGQMVFREYLTKGKWIAIDFSFPPGYGVPGWVIDNKKPYISNDTVNDPHVIQEIREQLGFYNLADTPILDRNGNLLGCFEIHNTQHARPFDEQDIELLQSLSASAAVALENARVIENLRQTQVKLKESQAYLRSLFDETPTPLWEEDFSAVKTFLDGVRRQGVSDLATYLREHPEAVAECARLAKVTDVNKATVELFEANSKANLLDNLDQVLTDESLDGFCEELISLANGERNALVSGFNKTLKGKKIEVFVKWSILPGYEDSWGKVIVSMIDITREREIDRLKSEFISTAAHELRTPLTVLMGYADLMQMEAIDRLDFEEKRTYFENIYEKGLVLERIVEDLLDVSKMETGRTLQVEKTPVQFTQLLTEICKDHQRETQKHTLRVELPSTDICILADSGKLCQVLDNLLNNAIKYSPEGGEIRVVGRIEAHRLFISISDPGIGMTEQQRERVFEKFYRADASNTAIPGLGLGMTLAKRIVEAHDGTIWVDSVPHQGTTVNFTIPLLEPKQS